MFIAFVLSCFALAHSARLTEKPIDLLPTPTYELKAMQDPRHISGYFQARHNTSQPFLPVHSA